MNGALHHLHLRRRRKGGLEPFPARTTFKRFLDHLMFVVAFLAPIALLPQVIRVFQDGDVAALSIYTWIALGAINAVWTVYGFVHKDKPIIIANGLVMLLDIAIVIGILRYS